MGVEVNVNLLGLVQCVCVTVSVEAVNFITVSV